VRSDLARGHEHKDLASHAWDKGDRSGAKEGCIIHELIQKQSFGLDLIHLGKNDQKKVISALDRIRQNPLKGNVKRIMTYLYSNLYRYRVGDLRICYALGTDCVSLLAVGLRKQIYARLERSPRDDSAISINGDSAVLQAVPRPFMTRPDDRIPQDLPEGDRDEDVLSDEETESMESPIFAEILEMMGLSSEHREMILACETADDLLDLSLPESVLESVLHLHTPPSIEETEHLPSYQLPDLDELDRDASKALSNLLLALDDEQSRAASAGSRGPLLVRGGPGTGKSIVALYRIRNLYARAQDNLLFEEATPRTLFVTYTKALTRVSEQLLGSLLGEGTSQHVRVKTIDSIAREVAGDFAQETYRNRGDSRVLSEKIVQARDLFLEITDKKTQTHATLLALPIEYILDEFQWVIDGRAINSLDEYLSVSRAGRGTRFGPELRRLVWRVYNSWLEDLEACGIATFEQVQGEAAARAAMLPEEEKFDVVVLDEAQDLKPVGIRLALAMCKDPAGFYMTADENQSIYGRGYSWRQVSSDLRVQGRTVLLRHNYRTTRQIQDAAVTFLRREESYDAKSTAVPVHEGPLPIICECKDEASIIEQWFRSWSDELRLPVYMGAVLVPTNAGAIDIAEKLLSLGVPASAFRSGDMDIDVRVVKCMTLHAAKGLEFPFVAIAGLTDDRIPRKSYTPVDEDDWEAHVQQERQLLHVAMTRAMWRLVICRPPTNPSPFFDRLGPGHWKHIKRERDAVSE
jgi:superfamily I DNA/RNA helicase/mRNA-degrading endonuclease RelE of RelBE toxin-antitoxin system